MLSSWQAWSLSQVRRERSPTITLHPAARAAAAIAKAKAVTVEHVQAALTEAG